MTVDEENSKAEELLAQGVLLGRRQAAEDSALEEEVARKEKASQGSRLRLKKARQEAVANTGVAS